MNSRSSIVDRLNFRSITGQRLGLDVHRCTKPRTRLFWNRNSITGCYMNYIGRYEADYYVSQQIQSFFENFGMHDACSYCYIKCRCCNIQPTYLDDRFGKICIYIDPKVWLILYTYEIIRIVGISIPVPASALAPIS